jgi:hypothetical protein
LGCNNNQDQNNQQQAEDNQNQQEDQNNNSEEDAQTGENLLTIDADTLDANLREKYDFAKRKATEWQNNASLVAIQVEVPSSLSKDSFTTRYVFSSPSVNYYYWTIGITADSTTYARALIPKEDYLQSDLDQILTNFWNLNFAEALQVTDQNGGSDWRENYKLGQIVLILSRGQPNNYHYWTVEYVAINGDGERVDSDNLKIKLSAETGEVVED